MQTPRFHHFQNADIYGGFAKLYDYGPLGIELKNNLKAAGGEAMVYERDDIEGLDAAIPDPIKGVALLGHEDTFPVDDRLSQGKGRFRADHIKRTENNVELRFDRFDGAASV